MNNFENQEQRNEQMANSKDQSESACLSDGESISFKTRMPEEKKIYLLLSNEWQQKKKIFIYDEEKKKKPVDEKTYLALLRKFNKMM